MSDDEATKKPSPFSRCPACHSRNIESCGAGVLCGDCCGFSVLSDDEDDLDALLAPTEPVSRAEVAETIHKAVESILGVRR
jgi:hypothetical protein